MAFLAQRLDLDVTSDPAGGAINVSANKARFEIQLEQPIHLPADAVHARVRVEEATVWNTVFNVSAGRNNNHIFITDAGATIDVTIPDGNYSTASLSSAINREYVALGGASGLVSLEEDFPTQKVIAVVDGTVATAPGGQIDWSVARTNTFRDLVGFNAQLVPAAPTLALVNQLGDNEANFNTLEYFKLHWDGGQGIRTNNSFSQTLARVNIDRPPGSQIVYAPFHPASSEAGTWVGTPRNHLVFWLTDQNDEEVDTGEIFSMRLVFLWEQWVSPDGGDDDQVHRSFKRVRLF